MAGLEFPTQKKPEAPSEESAFGGLPTPAWAMAKPKAAAVEKEKKAEKAAAAPEKKAAKAEAKPKKEGRKLSVDLSGVRTLESLLALVAVVAFILVGMVVVWFWPELNWAVRRMF